ncbi:MAG: response regulator [bacterium]|nr:response regulator [bacterium]
MIISCPSCKTAFNISDEKIPARGGKMRCFRCKEVFHFKGKEESNGRPLILVANESKAFCQTVSDLLEENGINAHSANDGEVALEKIRGQRPDIAIIDVALPKVFGFEVCEMVKNDPILKETKIILLAAIYDKTRYKRNPGSLYGADDYIEKHHIHDRLLDKIWEMVPSKGGIGSAESPAHHPSVVPPETEKDICDSAEEDFKEVEGEDHLKAARLARIIISDIALYNEALVVEGVKNNNLSDLLKDEIEEGRRLFMQRVSRDIWDKKDYLQESLDELIEKHAGAA